MQLIGFIFLDQLNLLIESQNDDQHILQFDEKFRTATIQHTQEIYSFQVLGVLVIEIVNRFR